MHANVILSQDVLDYSPLFGEIADAYFERSIYAEAARIYEILGGDPGVSISLIIKEFASDIMQTSSLYVLLQAAACRRMKGDLREAAEIYEHGSLVRVTINLRSKFRLVITADPTHKDAKMKLAEVYEILDEPRKALELVTQGSWSSF
jgi:general transcription factor 3C polypeptide 3 (transcription factor C subunit 4)